jgi:hypothetical protein
LSKYQIVLVDSDGVSTVFAEYRDLERARSLHKALVENYRALTDKNTSYKEINIDHVIESETVS